MKSEPQIRKALSRAERGLRTLEETDGPQDTITLVRCKVDVLRWVLGHTGTTTGLMETFADEIHDKKTAHEQN